MLSNQGISTPKSKIKNYFLKKLQDKDCKQLAKQMDVAKIDKSILLIADFTYELKDTPLTIQEIFEGHHQVLQKCPDKFIIFGGVDPRYGQDGISLFERSISRMGFKGLKLYPPCGFAPNDKRLYPYYEICKKENLPVLLHTGPTSPVLSFDYSDPSLIDRAALDFPEVNFILAHAGIKNYSQAAMMAEFRPNVYLDISGFQSELNPDLSQVISKIKWLFHNRVNHKVLFGTDWPLFNIIGNQKKWVNFFANLDVSVLSEEDKEKLFYQNMSHVMNKD